MWVAFGRRVTQQELDDSLAGHLLDGWPMPLDPIIEALENRAAGNWEAVRAEKRATQQLFGHPHGLGANINHLRRRNGLDRAALLALAKKKQADSIEFITRWNEASRSIIMMASADPAKLRMVGLREGRGVPMPIPFTVFLDPDIGAQINGNLGLAVPTPLDRLMRSDRPARDVPDWRDVRVNRDDLEREFPPRPPGRPAPNELAAKMQALKQAAPLLKRESAIHQLRRETQCTYREAMGAWSTLPPALRNRRTIKRA